MDVKVFEKADWLDKSYVKLSINKAHRGPVDVKKAEAAKAKALSAAANKIKVASDFTISFVQKDDAEETKTKTGFQAKSYVLLTESGNDAAEIAKYALALMQSWDQIYGSVGTDEYRDKLAEAVKAQANAYSELGINPCSGKRPNLTADQRAVYNTLVGPTGFDYFEYHLAYKQEGQMKMIRSSTYRSLEPLDINAIANRLDKAAKQFLDSVDIKAKSTN